MTFVDFLPPLVNLQLVRQKHSPKRLLDMGYQGWDLFIEILRFFIFGIGLFLRQVSRGTLSNPTIAMLRCITGV